MVKRLLREKAITFVCDIQDNFVPMQYKGQAILQAATMAVKMSQIFNIPVITTEHYQKVFGKTSQPIRSLLPQKFIIQKTQFSMLVPQVMKILKEFNNRNQIILVGVETHICILQTFLDLQSNNYQVFALADAITSSRQLERTIALKRIQKEGGIISSVESSAFEILKDSKSEDFKKILDVIKENGKRQNSIQHL